jgi:uncharacterized protein YdiU (UPF0061 family)
MLQTDMRAVVEEISNTYSELPDRFYARLHPMPVANPALIKFNASLAADLGLHLAEVSEDALAAIFSGNLLLPGSDPIAMAYAGHQFGHFVPQLGDGRALLLGEVIDGHGVRRDIQLKGSGRTPFSRGGDGRAAIGPVLREYIVSEAMHALGLPTTRSLAAVTTGEAVFRNAPVPGAVLTRVAASHVRVGTFEYFAARGDVESLRLLADYVIARLYPAAAAAASPPLELLRGVMLRQAALIAGWMHVGFIHGVMNTDNMAVSGETIDFGPCAFMDNYDPATVFSSIDHRGRYAYANQPAVGQWNLTRLAEALVPLIDPKPERAVELATAVLGDFSREFDERWLAGMRRKLGLQLEEAGDLALIRGLLDVMHRSESDFTLTFRSLCAASQDHSVLPPSYAAWGSEWAARLRREPRDPAARAAAMRLVNPAVIPRNHRIEQVIAAATERGDFAPFEELSCVLANPYVEHPSLAIYAAAPLPAERVIETFCGT